MKKEPGLNRPERLLVKVNHRGGVSGLQPLVRHKMYLAHVEPDGTIVLVPATIMPIKGPLRIELPEDS